MALYAVRLLLLHHSGEVSNFYTQFLDKVLGGSCRLVVGNIVDLFSEENCEVRVVVYSSIVRAAQYPGNLLGSVSYNSSLCGGKAMRVTPGNRVYVPTPLSGSSFWVYRTDDVKSSVFQDFLEHLIPREMG